MSTITKAPDVGRHRAGKPAKPGKPVKPVKPAKANKAPTASGPDKAPKGPRARSGAARRLVALLLLVVLTIASAVTAFLLHRGNPHTRSLRAVEADRRAAVTAAAQDVPHILGYDYRHLTADISAAKALATGQFLSDYTATAAKVLASAPGIKAIVTATVSGQAVVQAQSDRVTLLLFVDQESVKQLKGQKTATTRIDPFRVQLTMSKVHGHWMVSDLEPV
jgi:Mce-associated membrane protein